MVVQPRTKTAAGWRIIAVPSFAIDMEGPPGQVVKPWSKSLANAVAREVISVPLSSSAAACFPRSSNSELGSDALVSSPASR